MNITTFQQNLDQIRAWRKIELSHARSLAERQRKTAEEGYLCRVWAMMIYAHCDQALKLIAKEYISFLEANPRQDYDYKTVWIAFFGKEAFKSSDIRFALCGSKDSESNITILQNIKGKAVLDSSNFSYHSLRFFIDWVIQAKFDHGDYRSFCNTLKLKRDGIAHGEEITIKTVDDCLAWHEPAIRLLDDLVEATVETAVSHYR